MNFILIMDFLVGIILEINLLYCAKRQISPASATLNVSGLVYSRNLH